MPILPIDLQTNFSQIGSVGKEQAVQRETAPLQQAAQASEMVQQAYRQDRSVSEARDSQEGETVDDRERRRRSPGRGDGKKGTDGEGPDEGKRRGEGVIRDPALGSRIDVVR